MGDFFAWSKILPMLLYPFPSVLLIILILTWRLGKAPMRWTLRGFVVLLWVLSTPLFAHTVLSWWQPAYSHRADLPAVSDVAVVLGGLSDGGWGDAEHLNFNSAAERLTEAVQLWREGRVKNILITSGSGTLTRPWEVEAPGLAHWARQAGVPEANLWVESASRNTYENARNSLVMVDAQKWKSVVLITSGLHMPRSKAIFLKAGYARNGHTLTPWTVDRTDTVPDLPFGLVADPGSLEEVQSLLKEAVGFVVYAAQGYL